MRNNFYLILILTFSFSSYAKEIRYPYLEGLGADSLGFAVLNLALEKSEEQYTVSLYKTPAGSKRIMHMLKSGKVDVIDGGYSLTAESDFDLIYLPFDLGLSGIRVFVVNSNLLSRLSRVHFLEDLKSFTFGQGFGWYDVKILEHAGLKVITAPKLSNLVGMVGIERFDILPLGIHEAQHFIDTLNTGNNDLVIDKRLILEYPFGRFFYVRKGEKELKNAIKKGLEIALEEGSLLQLLQSKKYFYEFLSPRLLDNRTVIHIDTPGLSDEFKLIDSKWWYFHSNFSR